MRFKCRLVPPFLICLCRLCLLDLESENFTYGVFWQVKDKYGNPCYGIQAPINVSLNTPLDLDTGNVVTHVCDLP